MKIVIKFAILQKNDVFSEEEAIKTQVFHEKFFKLQLTIISFFEVEYSFDLNYIQKLIHETHDNLKEIMKNHLSEKSINRIDEIFSTLSNNQFLEEAFRAEPSSPSRIVMARIVTDLNEIIERK